MFWNFVPWTERHSSPEPRIHEELTEPAMNRLANILKELDYKHIRSGYNEMVDYTGHEIELMDLSGKHSTMRSQYNFIRSEDYSIDLKLTYMEYVLNVALGDQSRRTYEVSARIRNEIIHKIQRTFEDEGILVHVKPSPAEVVENNWRPSPDDLLTFQQVSDETIIEADQEVRTLALGDEWESALEPYNKAWQLYKEGNHTTAILEKLWNSLEMTTETICSDMEDWEDEGQGVGRYLEVLKEKGLFRPNPAIQQEASHISQSLRVTLDRLGGDRKRHVDIDPDYCIFVLHQTSAYLSFIIKRYEEAYS